MDKISPIKKNILQFLEYKGITKTEFCEKTGISYANMKGKGLQSEIGGTQIGKILSIYNEINPEWLITGKGEMLRDAVSKQEVKPDCTEVVKDKNRIIELLEADNERLKSELDQIKSDKESADKTRKNVH